MTITVREQPVDSERQSVSIVAADAALPRPVLLLCAIACGLAVAGITYAQPMLDVIADEFRIDHASAGIIVTVAQVGYALGLIFIVPLGDVLNRRRLILGQSMLATLALLAVALAPSPTVLLAGMAGVGSLAVVIQVIVAYAAMRAAPAERGRAVGLVTSGVVGGILLARTGTGMLADLSGWRTVFMASAAATLVVAALLFCVLPREERQHEPTPYVGLVGSLLHLIKSESILRDRAIMALLVFAAYTSLVTPLVLPLSAPPHSLSHAAIGVFGLSGLAGMLGATIAGQRSDRGYGRRVTAQSLSIMLAAWLPISFLPVSFWSLVLGILAMDFGLQSVHVANQSVIYRIRPDAQSRIAAAYMLFYSIGCGSGAVASTFAYAHAGWLGVCFLGASFSTCAIAYWVMIRRARCRPIA